MKIISKTINRIAARIENLTKEQKANSLGLIVVCLALIVVFFRFGIGDYYFIYGGIGSDTKRSYYPYLINEVKTIREHGIFLYSWDYGLGISIFHVQHWVFDPFSLLVVIFGVIFGARTVQYTLAFMQMLKILLTFLVGRRWVRHYIQNVWAVNVASYFLAFNGFLFLWGQHYFFGTAFFYCLVILLLVDELIEEKKNFWRKAVGLSIAIALLFIFSYYIGYMVFVIAICYYFLRYYELNKFKGLGVYLGKTAVTVIIGVAVSASIMIPAVIYVVTTSSRLGAGFNISTIIADFASSLNLHEIVARLSNMMSNNWCGVEEYYDQYFPNYYEKPELFMTGFMAFFLWQWIWKEFKATLHNREWPLFIIKILAMYMLLFNNLTGYIFNGFQYVCWRYTYVAMPFLAIIIAKGCVDLLEKRVSVGIVLISAFFTFVTWYYSLGHCSEEVVSYVKGSGLLLLVGYVLLLALSMEIKYTQIAVAFLGLAVISNVADNYFTTNEREVVNNCNYSYAWVDGKIIGNTQQALKWIRENDSGFYRVSKTYFNWASYADSRIEGYSSPDYYNSTIVSGISEFFENIYINGEDCGLTTSTKLSLENTMDQRAVAILDVKYILSKEPLDQEYLECEMQFGDVYVYKNLDVDSVAKWYNSFVEKTEFESLNSDEQAEVLKNNVVLGKKIVVDSDSEAAVSEFVLTSNTTLEGDVQCDGTGILTISVPLQNVWKVYANGEEVETFITDYGFVGIKLDAGAYHIQVKHQVPGIPFATIVSLLGIMGLTMEIVFGRKKYEKK